MNYRLQLFSYGVQAGYYMAVEDARELPVMSSDAVNLSNGKRLASLKPLSNTMYQHLMSKTEFSADRV